MSLGWTFSWCCWLILLAVLHSLNAVPTLKDLILGDDEIIKTTKDPLDLKEEQITYPKDQPLPGFVYILKKNCKKNSSLPLDDAAYTSSVESIHLLTNSTSIDNREPVNRKTILYQSSNKSSTDAIKKNEAFELKDYTGYRVYRVTIPTELAAKWILKFEDLPGIEFWADPKWILKPRGIVMASAADILVAPYMTDIFEEALKEAFLPFEILIPNLQEAIKKENPSDSLDLDVTSRVGHRLTWDRYHPYDDIDSYLEYLRRTFPDFVTVEEIGRSTEGRAIKVIKLHKDGGRTDRKIIFIDAGIHAREWISPATITYMIKELVEGGGKYDCILNLFDFHFVPIINPDGYEYSHTHNRMWRKTRSKPDSIVFSKTAAENLHLDRLSRFDSDPVLSQNVLEQLRLAITNHKGNVSSCQGADGNRNFDFQWLKEGSSKNPCSAIYAGPRPFSEPETKALSNYILSNQNRIGMFISLHSYSQAWLLPWRYTEDKPSDYPDLYSLAEVAVKASEKVHGTRYKIPTPDLLYRASGSSIDWAKGVAGIKYAYTLELRDLGKHGFILPVEMIVPSGQETWAAVYAGTLELGSRIYPDAIECPTN